MTDESGDISMRTWIRNVGPINKVGYSDGVTDGQAATYQSSFDTGYEQGLNFGFCLGLIDTKTKFVQKKEQNLRDPRKINCQICINNSLEGNLVNLFNLQKEKNDEYLVSQGMKS